MIAAITRNAPASSPIENPIVATNRPTRTNESASPAASATGPARCALTAVPSTIGNSGSTQGDSVERTPARKASATLPMFTSDRLLEQPLDRVGIGIAAGTANLLLALEGDHGALHAHIELAQQILLGIEVDVEAHQVLELRRAREFGQDWCLRPARRAPGGR